MSNPGWSDWQAVEKIDPEIAEAILAEVRRENTKIELIASENFSSPAVLAALGTPLTNKYAEGYPGKRYYGGCEFVDVAENLAIERAKAIFGAEHVNVQPHAGAQANLAAYFAFLDPGDTFMGMGLAQGGHLTHGSPVNFTGRMFKIVSYGVRKDDERIDLDEVRDIARRERPKMIVAGATAYSRIWDFAAFRDIADEVGAIFLVDAAHFIGLVAGGAHPSPVPYADVVTCTTHKTLRGPRGAMIMCKEEHAKAIDKSVFPGWQGGPLMHSIAAKAVAFAEAATDEFREYSHQIVKNADVMASTLTEDGLRIVSGGTDNHLMLVDLRPVSLTGKEAEARLDDVGITVNKNAIPYDPEKPFIASGIRVGTPAVTTSGMKETEIETVAKLIAKVLQDGSEATKGEVRRQVAALTERFRPYPDFRG
ncbi:MAG TPA: serine hydroxymethyltransferase [Actinomycetota bacterium]|jgi:glycine hydroxymethyltransferase|nr:serine hydroxymethyltransferase [Actinomycetota bacterium]